MNELQEQIKVKDRAEFILDCYKKVFPNVARLISRQSGSLEDAKDVFQEAIVLYYERSHNTVQNDEAYLYGIARHLWYKRTRQFSLMISLDKNQEFQEITEVAPPKPSALKLLNFLERAGKKCLNILSAFYYEKISAKELSSRFGFANERSATVQKFKCLEKVRNEVTSKKLSYEDFCE